MLFGGRRPAEITRADLDGLLGVVAEGTGVDYKRAIGTNDEAKREFAADITSFANTEGGFLLVGIDELERVATEITGVEIDDVDAEILRLENLARDTVSPRLPSFEVGSVDVDGRVVLAVRVGRSWIAPHMVTFRGSSKFFQRNSAGKYPLDVDQIRHAFVRAIEGATRVRRFHVERVDTAVANRLPRVALLGGPKIVMHLIPAGALEGGQGVDVTLAQRDRRFRPMWSDHPEPTEYTIEGVVARRRPPDRTSRYLLLFRSGIIEAIDAALLSLDDDQLLGYPFERSVIDDSRRFLDLQRDLGVEPPVVLLVTLLDVLGSRITALGNPLPPAGGWPTIDRNRIELPEVVIDDFGVDLPSALRSTFDAFWQSGGVERSPNYDANGVWLRQD